MSQGKFMYLVKESERNQQPNMHKNMYLVIEISAYLRETF